MEFRLFWQKELKMIARDGLKRLLLPALLVAAWLAPPNQKVVADEGPSADKATSESKSAEVQPANKAAASVAPEFTIGEGDVLKFAVWKESELSQTVKVRPDGNISLPLISEVHVAGLTTNEIQQVVTTKLKAYLVDPQVNIEITEIHSRQVFITGEITRPGIYPLLAPISVLQLIAQAGGFSPFAKRKNIVILRKEKGKQLRLPFNYKEVVHGRSTEENILLQPGDTVVVP